MPSYKLITFEEWKREYQPVYSDPCDYVIDGYNEGKYIWSLYEDGWVFSGFHGVNVIGYFFSPIPYESEGEEETILVFKHPDYVIPNDEGE